MKQMCDMSEKLVSEEDEIYGVKTIEWEDYAWKTFYLWLVTNKSTYFQILCYALERWATTHNQVLYGKTSWRGSKSSSQDRSLDTLDAEPMEFEWNICPGFTSFQLCYKVQEFLSKMSTEPEVCGSHGQNTEIETKLIWKHRVLLGTCRKRGRNIKTWCIGSTSILLWGKVWSSIKHDRTLSFFTKHFQLVVFRKLLERKLEK